MKEYFTKGRRRRTFQDYLKGKEVKIVPWAHSIDSLSHESVSKYVKTLPKNSFLALEVSSNDVIELEKELASPNAVNLLSLECPDNFRHKKMSAAFLEILFECKKRNIRVVSINSNIRKSQALKKTQALIGNTKIIIGDAQTLANKGIKTNIFTKIFSRATLKQNNYRINLLREATMALKKTITLC